MGNPLWTAAGEALTGTPWTAYPRPRLRREQWLCLNGDWSLRQGTKTGRVRVPFCPESLLSRWDQPVEYGAPLQYARAFSLPPDWAGRRILLHFGAVSRTAEVSLNGRLLGSHDGAYTPFSFDVTDFLRPGENLLEVAAVNDLDFRRPWGKQTKKPGGMWYTPCSGIWQTVWLEPVPETYIHGLHAETGPDWAELRAEGVSEGTVTMEGREYPLKNGICRIALPAPRLWSPEDPHLYRFTVAAGEDRAESYFALRTLTTQRIGGVPRLCLNGRPVFLHALLDQGYWSDGLWTPAAPEGYETDIRAMQSLGFNALRKHIKLEPQQFYYDCDRLGMLVLQDMVSSGKYRYIRDTALPTLGLQTRKDRRLHRDPAQREIFLQSMKDTVDLLRDHPSIVLWTIFNEGWGQFDADGCYDRLRALDPTRWIDSTSGWFHQTKSDVDSLHIYFDTLHPGKKPLPQLLSEFGGYVWKLPEHSWNLRKTYGYRKYETREELVSALRQVYREEVLPLARQCLCGAVYTQVSDVEDETNGLFTWDRRVLKVRPEELREFGPLLQAAVREND